MAELLLFHHVQGLTGGVVAFASELRTAGHSVTVPDLYGGATFGTIEAGVEHAEALGFDAIVQAGVAVAQELPEHTVYAGFSLGALIAHKLAQTRPGAAGAFLYHHGDVPLEMFGDSWPAGVPLQMHINERDEFYEPDTVAAFVERAATSAPAELFVYPGASHLFADSSLPGCEPESASLLMRRTLEFLARR